MISCYHYYGNTYTVWWYLYIEMAPRYNLNSQKMRPNLNSRKCVVNILEKIYNILTDHCIVYCTQTWQGIINTASDHDYLAANEIGGMTGEQKYSFSWR